MFCIIFCQMTGFEHPTSGMGSHHSANCATTTAPVFFFLVYLFVFLLLANYIYQYFSLFSLFCIYVLIYQCLPNSLSLSLSSSSSLLDMWTPVEKKMATLRVVLWFDAPLRPEESGSESLFHSFAFLRNYFSKIELTRPLSRPYLKMSWFIFQQMINILTTGRQQ